LEDAIEYAQSRKIQGQPIAENQGIRWKIADMAMRTDQARLLTHRAADRIDRGDDTKGLETSMAKIASSEAAIENAHEAIQIHGGYGYTKEYSVERYLRDAQYTTIVEGPNEIHRNLIANRVIDG
jgi:alkylation response protein AidB-like acyl-CoA dehydrogenase